MIRLLADGGSTKIDWALLDDDRRIATHRSVGINPSILAEDDIHKSLCRVLADCPSLADAQQVEFYGAGCTPVASRKMEVCLRKVLPAAETIVVDSDIIGAAKALLGDEEGIACILGTGACSCLWGRVGDGMGIVRQTPALGYILGDEGSGAVLGKMFINALYKGVLPQRMKEDFEQEYGIDMYGVIEHVYRQPLPNRWLASLSPFVLKNLGNETVENIVCDNLRAFFVRNILPYQRPDLTVNFVGSIAFYYESQLRHEASKLNIQVGKILKSPLT